MKRGEDVVDFLGGRGERKFRNGAGTSNFPARFPSRTRGLRGFIHLPFFLEKLFSSWLAGREFRSRISPSSTANARQPTPSRFIFPPPLLLLFPFFLKKRWKIFHPRLRTVRGAAPSGLTEKCIKGEGDIRKVYMPVVPSLFRLFNDILHGQHFYDAYGLTIKVIVVTLLLPTFDFDIDFSFTLYTYVRVCLPKKRMPKEIWRKVSLHEWSWILYIRFGIKQRQHRVPEKIAFSQETGGNRVEGWKLGQRQFLGETISRNEMRKRFVRNDLET